MQFVAVDVETANSDMASICSIGIATFKDGSLVDEWYSLIDPEDYFDRVNISVHGIEEADVRGMPTFRLVAAEVERRLLDQVVVTHTHFDRVALNQASARELIPAFRCTWLDTSRVVRRTWSECARSGYGLSAICERIGYSFNHHHALEDAKAAGHVLIAAIKESNLDLDSMLQRALQPITPSASGQETSIKRDGNVDGQFFGEVVVFTGALNIPRREAADLAALVGCDVVDKVTKKTTILVVGDTDVQRLAGHSKSSKHRKAEELAKAGHQIRIIRETDFKLLVVSLHA